MANIEHFNITWTESFAMLRHLEASNDEVFKEAEMVAQVFSGIFFTGLALWLSYANGANLGYIQQASLEKRLTVISYLCCYVATFSAFFNYFQLTDVQRVVIPRPGNYVLDLARPVEWIATCPLMQLAVVLLGGSRLPGYRRFLMPTLSIIVLLCGLSAQLTPVPYNYLCYAAGLVFAVGMFSINRLQIMEHSNWEEGLFSGESDFRRVSVLLIVTWVPFPIFFFLTPEGLGLITNIVFVQVGWAFLNIVSKFTFIFFLQRVKDQYISRLKVKREIMSSGIVPSGPQAIGGSVTPPNMDHYNKAQGELNAIVVETMGFLGMAQHADRFLRLLQRAEVNSLEQIEKLKDTQCDKLQLPWDLMSAVQKRLRVYKMQMADTAVMELEKGEAHYNATDGIVEGAIMRLGPVSGNTTPANYEGHQRPLPGAIISMESGSHEDALDSRLNRLEEMMIAMMEKAESTQMMVARQQQDSHKVEEAVSKALQVSRRVQEADVEGSLKIRLEELVRDVTERVTDRVTYGLQQRVEDFAGAAHSGKNEALELLVHRLESVMQRESETTKRSLETFSKDTAKADTRFQDLNRKLEELDRSIGRKFEELGMKTAERSDRVSESLRSAVQADMSTLMGRSDLVNEAVREANHNQKEAVADLRRVCMMTLEQVNGSQERSQSQMGNIMELRGTVDAGFERTLASLADLKSRGEGQNGASAPLLPGQSYGDSQWTGQSRPQSSRK